MEFVDDLLTHRWKVIIGLALVVFADKVLRVSGGWLQSRSTLAVVVVAIFGARLLMRRGAGR